MNDEPKNTGETLAAYITAARQIGEVTGKDLLEGLILGENLNGDAEIRVPWSCLMGDLRIAISQPLAIDILYSRVWRAVWSLDSDGPFGYRVLNSGPIVSVTYIKPNEHTGEVGRVSLVSPPARLPSAVAAIYEHWKGTR